jgi:hypothetical protein
MMSASSILIFRGLWRALRLPVLVFLVILEPVVSSLLGGAALLGVLMTFFWKWVGPPTFPFWTMLALSLGFGLALLLGFGFALLLYERLIAALRD